MPWRWFINLRKWKKIYDVYSRKGKLKSKIERVKPITQEEIIKNLSFK